MINEVTAVTELAAASSPITGLRAVIFWVGIASIGLGSLLGMFPLWKSAVLSPDSIERRTYWTGSSVGLVLLLVSQLPDWRAGLFLFGGFGFAIVGIALCWTNHVKIAGRVISGSLDPDRPPTLAKQEEAE